MPPTEKVRVSESKIREVFNQAGYLEQVRAGVPEFSPNKLRGSDIRALRLPGSQSECTWSQMIAYYDANNYRVALVHQYLRPDGRIGASGLHDPKRVYYDGRVYFI